MALSWTMDKIGPMCRSAEDCGLVLQVIAGKDGNDPASAGKSFYFTPQYARSLKTVRAGYSPADFESWAEPETRPAFLAALEVVECLGVTLVETKLPELPYGALTGTVIDAEAASVFEELIESGKVDELADKHQVAGLRASLDIRARDYLKAMRIRTMVRQEFRRLLTEIDVFLAPARYGVAPKVSESLDKARPVPTPPPQSPGLRDLIPAGNLAGLPALSLPCGFAGNLPVALQLVSRPFSENLILAIGIEFQKRTDWHKKRPNI
jgi:aspartyl-tRNA(Asn)/glutamyl-tRNA(Gln) amidotransferase subunit A